MKRICKTFTPLTIYCVFILVTGCKQDEPIKPLLLSELTTTEVISISNYTAKSGGKITSDAGSTIISRGVCWSETANPTIASNKTVDGGGIGSFTSLITGLNAETTYYVRAYATNSDGTAYGSTYQFKTLTSPNSIIYADIPAGTFTMGSPITEVNRIAGETQHRVTLSAFRMSKYEITNAQYADFLNTNGIGITGLYTAGTYPTQSLISNSAFGLSFSGSQWVAVQGYENNPIIGVTWYGAAEYATSVGGTLPTESQWEYACRAGTTTTFNTGQFLTNLQANYNWEVPYNGGTNTVITSPGKTQPVGTYAANAFGLYDMHGNAREWCADWYGSYPYIVAPNNPTGATLGSVRVIRGGSWGSDAQDCRSAHRSSSGPDNGGFIGFRVVLVP